MTTAAALIIDPFDVILGYCPDFWFILKDNKSRGFPS